MLLLLCLLSNTCVVAITLFPTHPVLTDSTAGEQSPISFTPFPTPPASKPHGEWVVASQKCCIITFSCDHVGITEVVIVILIQVEFWLLTLLSCYATMLVDWKAL